MPTSSGGWTAGVVRHGPEPKAPATEPLSWLRMTFLETSVRPNHYTTADDAIADRIRRLREMKTPFTRDGMSIKFEDGCGVVTLDYLTEAEG